MVDFNEIPLKTHQLLCIGAEMIHQFDLNSNYDGYMIIFTDHFFCSDTLSSNFLRNTTLFNPLHQIQGIDISAQLPVFERIIKSLMYEVQESTLHGKIPLIKNYLFNLLLSAERILLQNTALDKIESESYQITTQFKQCIQAFFTTEKQVQFYVEKLKIHEKKLNKATQQVIGKTAKETINYHILLEAKRLLAHSNQSIKEICYALGYNEPTNFVKYFKNLEGCTPFDFRKKF